MLEGFVDSYKLKWKLRNDFGDVWEEEMDNLSLSDFEIVYGNNSFEILQIELRLMVDEGKSR